MQYLLCCLNFMQISKSHSTAMADTSEGEANDLATTFSQLLGQLDNEKELQQRQALFQDRLNNALIQKVTYKRAVGGVYKVYMEEIRSIPVYQDDELIGAIALTQGGAFEPGNEEYAPSELPAYLTVDYPARYDLANNALIDHWNDGYVGDADKNRFDLLDSTKSGDPMYLTSEPDLAVLREKAGEGNSFMEEGYSTSSTSMQFVPNPGSSYGPADENPYGVYLYDEAIKGYRFYMPEEIAASEAFGIMISPFAVGRILRKYGYKGPPNNGPSWLTFLGHMKDSLWSIDLFRCESITLKSHWVMVVMDQFTRRIIGFAVHVGDPCGVDICCMFNKIISGRRLLPKYLSTDNDPLFKYHRWQANLRILDIKEIKSVPYTPSSHPFIERVIGTCRREFLDHILFFNERDLQQKLSHFKNYYNETRVHSSLALKTPSCKAIDSKNEVRNIASLNRYCWKPHANGLYQLPVAA